MAITTRIGMPLDEFIEAQSPQPFELIDGERIAKLATVAGHGEVSNSLAFALRSYGVEHQLGMAYTEITFVLPEVHQTNWVTGSRIPDVMFYTTARLAEYKANTPDWKGRPFALVPDLVIDVVSQHDTYSKVQSKVDVYLQDGVRLIWLIDVKYRKAIIQGAIHPLQRLTGDAVLDGEDVIPGFQIILSSLFE